MRGEEIGAYERQLTDILLDCVRGGASVGFLSGISVEDAIEFFRHCARETDAGRRVLLVTFRDGQPAGCVQLVTGMPENQPHRAEIAKLLVASAQRRQGIGHALMEAAEAEARRRLKTLLVVDTASGSGAERLGIRMGWTKAGEIPNYALLPDGRPTAISIFWKGL